MGDRFHRNVWCHRYNRCLARAVEENEAFTCKNCEFNTDQAGKIEIDLFGDALLAVAVLFPDVYRAYRRFMTDPGNETKRRKVELLINKINFRRT